MTLSLVQQEVLAITPHITGFVSVLFSLLTLWFLGRSSQRRSLVYHRLVAGIALVDLSTSLWLGLSTWPAPRSGDMVFASGTVATCRLQGFFIQFGISSSMYNASLSLYYLLVVRYGWKEIKMKRVEPFLHGIPITWALCTAITALLLDLLGEANLWCWIDNKNDTFRWAFFYGVLWLMIAAVAVNSLLVYFFVLRIESQIAQYKFASMVAATNNTEDPAQPTCAWRWCNYFKILIGMIPNEYDDVGDVMMSGANEAERNPDEANELATPTVPYNSPIQATHMRHNHTSKEYKRTRQVASQCFLYTASFLVCWLPITVRCPNNCGFPECIQNKANTQHF
jgi:hypothetical protein